MNYITHFLSELWSISVDMAPYLLLGFLFAGILKVFVKSRNIHKYLGGSPLKSSINASLLGVPLPLCSCGVIPTGVSLFRQGASKPATVSFLISTPQTGIDSILATWSLMGLPFAIIRPIAAFISGITGGIAAGLFGVKKEQTSEQTLESEHDDELPQGGNKLTQMMRYAFVDFVADIARWLLLGIVLAAVISVVIPAGFFESLAPTPWLSMVIILLISIPLYVCATGSIPIAAALILKGLSPGAAFVLLMAGPATNIATITVLWRTIGKRTTIIYVLSIVISALAWGLVIDYLLPASWFSSVLSGHGCETGSHPVPQWLGIGSAVVMYALIALAIVRPLLTSQPDQGSTTIGVEGMSCGRCKDSVERAVGQIEGVSSAKVNLSRKSLTIQGSGVDMQRVAEVIASLGYRSKIE